MNAAWFQNLSYGLKVYRFRITFRRVLNLIKAFASVLVSKLAKTAVTLGSPPILMIEPTNHCNLRCPMCPAGNGTMKRSKGTMSVPSFQSILDTVGDRVAAIFFWNYGEPFLNPHLAEMIRRAKTKGIIAVTSTNGHFLNEKNVDALVKSGLDEIIISVEGTDQQTYERYRKSGNFQTVLDGIQLLVERKRELSSKRPLINLQFITFHHNQKQVSAMISLGKQLHVDRVTFKRASFHLYFDKEGRISGDMESVSSFLPGTGTAPSAQAPLPVLPNRQSNWCFFPWFFSIITWNGEITPCCYDKDAQYSFGNIFRGGKNLDQIWQNGASGSFRRKLLKDVSSIDLCKKCHSVSEKYLETSIDFA